MNGRVTTHGFDLSGFDLWSAGTLFKNISFSVLPAVESSGALGFEAAFVRFDNLKGSRWLNFKIGKFELDNMISEKRFLFLSSNGGYQSYHFVPPGEQLNAFGLGDNQLGAELSGHSVNSYTRYGVAEAMTRTSLLARRFRSGKSVCSDWVFTPTLVKGRLLP